MLLFGVGFHKLLCSVIEFFANFRSIDIFSASILKILNKITRKSLKLQPITCNEDIENYFISVNIHITLLLLKNRISYFQNLNRVFFCYLFSTID